MDRKTFKDGITKQLQANGFHKEGVYFYKDGIDIICVVGLQKSAYSRGYYIEVGYVIKKLHSSLIKLREVDGDIRARFNYEAENKRTDLFDPEKFSDRIHLQQALQDNLDELMPSSLNMDGLKNLINKRPGMLYLTVAKAKKFLGFE